MELSKLAKAIGTSRGSGSSWLANINAPGLKGPGELIVILSSVSLVPSGAMTSGLFWSKIFCVSTNNFSFLFFFSKSVSLSLSDSGVCTKI